MKRRNKYRPLVAKFLNLAPKERSKVQLRSNQLSRHHTSPSNFTCKQDVVDFLIQNNIRTQCQLEARRKADKKAPSMHFVRKYFVRWSKLSAEIYGGIYLKPKKTDNDILRVISDFNIFTVKEYNECRKKCPELFISMKCLIERFGSWDNAKLAAYGTSARSILERFIALNKKLHAWPTIQECKDNAIDFYKLTSAISVEELKEIVRCLDKGEKNEKQRRN